MLIKLVTILYKLEDLYQLAPQLRDGYPKKVYLQKKFPPKKQLCSIIKQVYHPQFLTSSKREAELYLKKEELLGLQDLTHNKLYLVLYQETAITPLQIFVGTSPHLFKAFYQLKNNKSFTPKHTLIAGNNLQVLRKAISKLYFLAIDYLLVATLYNRKTLSQALKKV